MMQPCANLDCVSTQRWRHKGEYVLNNIFVLYQFNGEVNTFHISPEGYARTEMELFEHICRVKGILCPDNFGRHGLIAAGHLNQELINFTYLGDESLHHVLFLIALAFSTLPPSSLELHQFLEARVYVRGKSRYEISVRSNVESHGLRPASRQN